MIACGDDKGQLWLYNQPQFGRDPGMEGVAVAGKDQEGGSGSKDNKENKDKDKAIPQLEVSARLSWPELQDDHLENSRKVPLDRHDIIVDKVAASHDGHHIVAVTSNNMVCIWRRTSDDDSSSTTASE